MFPINVVEKETGISKYLLRMWERRYSFPRPLRDPKGERVYSSDDVEKLKIVKALMEEGYRPSKIIDQNMDALKTLLNAFSTHSNGTDRVSGTIILVTVPDLEQDVRQALRNHDVKKILMITSKADLENLTF